MLIIHIRRMWRLILLQKIRLRNLLVIGKLQLIREVQSIQKVI